MHELRGPQTRCRLIRPVPMHASKQVSARKKLFAIPRKVRQTERKRHEDGSKEAEMRTGVGDFIYFTVMFLLASYFMFASVQGDFGLFRRLQIEAELIALENERDRLTTEVSALENKTRRLSGTHLDLDLLDSQARDVLGLIRPDEIVLN